MDKEEITMQAPGSSAATESRGPAAENRIPEAGGRPPAADPFSVNSSVLAFIGDAVYETFARVHVYEQGLLRADRLNTAATAYVRAEAQAYAFDRLQPELTEREASVARRGKNHKITSMPKNVDPMVYKKATGFEALLGYLELAGDRQRLEHIVARAFEIIAEKDFSRVKR